MPCVGLGMGTPPGPGEYAGLCTNYKYTPNMTERRWRVL